MFGTGSQPQPKAASAFRQPIRAQRASAILARREFRQRFSQSAAAISLRRREMRLATGSQAYCGAEPGQAASAAAIAVTMFRKSVKRLVLQIRKYRRKHF
jgi:hypothetical protein